MVLNQKRFEPRMFTISGNVNLIDATLNVDPIGGKVGAPFGQLSPELRGLASDPLDFCNSIKDAGGDGEAGCIDGGSDSNPTKASEKIRFSRVDPKNGGEGTPPCPPDIPYRRALGQFGYGDRTPEDNDDDEGGNGNDPNPPDIPSRRD